MASDFRLKEQLPNLTNRIVATYAEVGSINYLGHCPLPQYEAVVEILDELKEIMYPGYRRRVGLHIGNVTYHAGDLIDGLHDKLTVQIGRALRHESRIRRGEDCAPGPDDHEAKGQAIAIEFLERIPTCPCTRHRRAGRV